MAKTPKLSIITVNLNNAKGLKTTLDSVTTQTYTNYEHILIDGGSTDSSVEIIKQYKNIFNGAPNDLIWLSEPDKGVFNAMNKGIKIAKGEYCLFLNSGDWLIEENGLKQVFDLEPEEDIVYCDLQSSNKDYIYPDKLTLQTFFEGSLGHPCTFIKTKLFQKLGGYNESYKITSDWHFFIKAIIINQSSYIHYHLKLTFFERGGVSTNEQNNHSHILERQEILKKYFPKMYDDYVLMDKLKLELDYYKNSKLIQWLKKMQDNWLYKFLRRA